MKKKAVIVMIAMCMVLSASACGNDSAKETKTDTKTEKTSEKETAQKSDIEKSSDTDKKEAAAVKLVSVDDVSDYVDIGEYKGLKLNRITQDVTDDDVQTEIDYELEANGDEVTDGTVEEGDTVTVNFTGTIDGMEFDGGSAEDYELTVGEGSMIDGFEEGLIGMKAGETKELDLTFPEDYYEDSVAGKAVVFKVTLQKFTRKAELTDQWVEANTDYKTVDEYKQGVRQTLEEDARNSAELDLYDSAWSEVLSASDVKKYPEADVNSAVDVYKSQTEQYVDAVGIEMSDFLDAQGITEEEYEDECRQYGESKVEQNLIVQGIMDAEGLTLEDEGIDELKQMLCQEYGVTSTDEIIEYYGEQEVNESLALLRVEKYIVDQATVEEKTGSEDDLIANEDALGEDEDVDAEYTIDMSEEGLSEESDTEDNEDSVADEDQTADEETEEQE